MNIIQLIWSLFKWNTSLKWTNRIWNHFTYCSFSLPTCIKSTTQWSVSKEQEATEGAVITGTVKDNTSRGKNQVNFFTRIQLQHNRVSEITYLVLTQNLIKHDHLIVLEHVHTCITWNMTTHSELEIIDPFNRCCEETYRGWIEILNKEKLDCVYLYRLLFVYSLIYLQLCSKLPVAGL